MWAAVRAGQGKQDGQLPDRALLWALLIEESRITDYGSCKQ